MSNRIVGTWTEWDGEKIVTRDVYENDLYLLTLPPYGKAEYEADRKRLAEFVERYGGWPPPQAKGD